MVGDGANDSITGSSNTAVGATSLANLSTGSNNTAIGNNSMRGDAAPLTGDPITGNNNTGVGASSLQNVSTGSNNTATGNQALQANTIGNDNSAYGGYSLFSSLALSFQFRRHGLPSRDDCLSGFEEPREQGAPDASSVRAPSGP